MARLPVRFGVWVVLVVTVAARIMTFAHTSVKVGVSETDTAQRQVHIIRAEECERFKVIRNITGTHGTIRVLNFNENVTKNPEEIFHSLVYCHLSLRVPEGFFINITLDLPDFSCGDLRVITSDKVPECYLGGVTMMAVYCLSGKFRPVYTTTNQACIRVRPWRQGRSGLAWVVVHFSATRVSGRHVLPLVYTSRLSGYIASYHSPHPVPFAAGMSAFHDLVLPDNHTVVMVSFPLLDLGGPEPGHDAVLTLSQLPNRTWSFKVPSEREGKLVPPAVYNTSLRLNFTTEIIIYGALGFRMLFSFHPTDRAPHTLASGLLDCSVPHYASFKQHVHCNLEPECQGGQDEMNCPFSHPACNGSLGYGDRCYRLIMWPEPLTWREAESACRARGGDMANVKTPGQRQAVSQIFTYGKWRALYYIGVYKADRTELPPHYRHAWVWSDGTVAYDFNVSANSRSRWCYCDPFDTVQCWQYALRIPVQHFVCEFHSGLATPSARAAMPKPTWFLQNMVTVCPEGHVTHNFLSCDPDSHCGWNVSLASCTLPGQGIFPKFPCGKGKAWIHYSSVCDFRQDCVDGSDEKFCVHESNCPDRTCRNSQCFAFSQWCDGVRHCADSSDETGCRDNDLSTSMYAVGPPVVIDFDFHGNFSHRLLGPSESCPETHFRCPGRYVYCLPVYVRCNGVYDCPGHEDEAECQQYTCPGFYRCRASSVCLHAQHVCDGVFQCPQQDDEWMCSRNLTCPEGCRCQGLAFACTKPFPAHVYPDLRYMDARGSSMTLDSLTGAFYLVYLDLSSNNISVLPAVTLPNLLHLDVTDNNIRSLNVDVLLDFPNIRVLYVKNNPLVFLGRSQYSVRHENLHTVDISHSQLAVFNSTVFTNFIKISTLNMSYSPLSAVTSNGFSSMPGLVTLDLHGCLNLENFPPDVFRDLRLLQYIRTDTYKLCCRQTLPVYFQQSQCQAPVSEISSCEDLLRADVYRAALWLFAALSVTGNAGCLAFRLFVHTARSKAAFPVFVSSLGLADLLMGVYLAIIGTADQVYRGDYLWRDRDWKQHVVCKIAGFLSLLSSEVSAFTICLITLDRFLTLSFPFSVLRFGRRSAMLACCVVWTLGVWLAALPLLPLTSHWRFYSQTGICLPLPVTRRYFAGLGYSFGVMIVLNMGLFLLVAVGQVSIFWSVHTSSMTSHTTRRSQDLIIARRLISVAVSDFLCWFPVGLLGMLANRGIPIPGEVNVGLAIFVLPLNSALNPFLYTFNTLMERRRKAEDARILQWLEARCRLDSHSAASSCALTSTTPVASGRSDTSSATSLQNTMTSLLHSTNRMASQSSSTESLTISSLATSFLNSFNPLRHTTPSAQLRGGRCVAKRVKSFLYGAEQTTLRSSPVENDTSSSPSLTDSAKSSTTCTVSTLETVRSGPSEEHTVRLEAALQFLVRKVNENLLTVDDIMVRLKRSVEQEV